MFSKNGNARNRHVSEPQRSRISIIYSSSFTLKSQAINQSHREHVVTDQPIKKAARGMSEKTCGGVMRRYHRAFKALVAPVDKTTIRSA